MMRTNNRCKRLRSCPPLSFQKHLQVIDSETKAAKHWYNIRTPCKIHSFFFSFWFIRFRVETWAEQKCSCTLCRLLGWVPRCVHGTRKIEDPWIIRSTAQAEKRWVMYFPTTIALTELNIGVLVRYLSGDKLATMVIWPFPHLPLLPS